MKVFRIDGPFHKVGTMVFDLLFLNILWLVVSVLSLGLLMGNATVALYYSVDQCVVNQAGRPLFTFMEKMKSHFFKTFIISTATLILLVFSILNLMILTNSTFTMKWTLLIYMAVPLYIISFLPFVIALLAKTDLPVKGVVMYSFFLAFKHIGISFLSFIILLLIAYTAYLTAFLGLFVIVAPGFALISFLISKRVWPKYNFVLN